MYICLFILSLFKTRVLRIMMSEAQLLQLHRLLMSCGCHMMRGKYLLDSGKYKYVRRKG